MKSIYKLLLGFGVLTMSLSLPSCGDDFLNLTPSTALPAATAISDVEGAYAALYGVYDVLQDYGVYGCDMITYGDVRGGDMQNVDRTGSRALGFYTFNNRTPDNVRASLWTYKYYGLNRANLIIEALNNENSEITGEDRADVLGQALTLRALFHFDLVKLFGVPYLKDKTAPGAAIADRSFPATAKKQRATVAETYDFIVQDLKEARTQLNTIKLKKVNKGFINYWAATALLSRVYLYMGNYDESFSLAKELIDSKVYQLVSNADYIASFGKDFSTESIFDLIVTTADNEMRESIGSVASPDGYAEIIASTVLIDLLNEDPKDVRLNFLKPDKTKALGYFAKYPGRDGDYMINNIRIIRLSEIYLNAAEAALRKSSVDQASANTYLNAIRKRANPDASDITATIDNVLKERRKELAGEGHRFFDIMRLGLKVTRTGGRNFLNADEAITVGWDEPLCVLPVPRREININPDILPTPGYSNN